MTYGDVLKFSLIILVGLVVASNLGVVTIPIVMIFCTFGMGMGVGLMLSSLWD